MYDTAGRVMLVKKRIRESARRKQRRGICGLSALCMLLLAGLMQAMGMAAGQGQAAAQGVFGAMLLREDAGGYVLVGVVSFAAAVVLTVLCMRLANRGKRKDSGAEEPARQKQEGKKVGKNGYLRCCSSSA